MALHPKAGQPAEAENLINIPRLIADYYATTPDLSDSSKAVSFGTSGHRGSSFNQTFTDAHIAAICQAIAEYRQAQQISGPLFLGMDTHALSEPAFMTAVEVLVANDVQLIVEQGRGYTATPVISHAIINYNRGRSSGLGDGLLLTPSHNPPLDGGLKYNPPHGGPADTEVTNWIQGRANELLAEANRGVKRQNFNSAFSSANLTERDFAKDYLAELEQVIDLAPIKGSGLRMGVDPLGGALVQLWQRAGDVLGLNIDVVNTQVDPNFSFMHLDKDGKIRMDCSSPYAMSGLIAMREKFDLAFGNDADGDRHGIVTGDGGLMNPNHYLSSAIDYVYQNRPKWSSDLRIGKTLVSSSMIDRVANRLGREVAEMPVGFKWFVDGLTAGQIGFAGEESAGGIFLRRDGSPWATDKDGVIMCLLAAEMTAVTGQDPYQRYQALTEVFGTPYYKRIDVAADHQQKTALKQVDKNDIGQTELAGETITSIQTHAVGNGAAIGGVKVTTENGWFAARPSGTEDVYKIYAESFKGEAHLGSLIEEAETFVSSVIG